MRADTQTLSGDASLIMARSDDEKMDERKYKYHTVNVPMILANKIEEVIASGEHGYTSIPDFIKEAARKYLRELGYLK